MQTKFVDAQFKDYAAVSDVNELVSLSVRDTLLEKAATVYLSVGEVDELINALKQARRDAKRAEKEQAKQQEA
ncbi:hypothetical protein KC887_04395 [Candidatus Kaiserbacteria bacterium]|nr:hypothetical protein [Candidatus Kaiserbacteria bacterium]